MARGSRIVLCLAVVATAHAGGVSPSDVERGFASDHVIVQFHGARLRSLFSKTRIAADELKSLLSLPAGVQMTQAVSSLSEVGRPDLAGTIDPSRFVCMTVPSNLDARGFAALLATNAVVEYAEVDHVGTGGATVPNDPNFPSQWHHQNSYIGRTGLPADIRSVDAWDIARGSSNIVVAVLDSGVNTTLSEFAGRLVPGYDFVNNDTDPTDDEGHGTAVTGTLAANANNGVLVAGVDWKCKIMPLKVLDSSNNGFYSWWASAVDWAVSNGCKVINLSAGGFSSDTTLSNSIEHAVSQGVIFVTITHNDGTGTIRFPGTIRDAITVGATQARDSRCSFSNYGPQIDLVAPGTNIFTVGRFGTLEYWWGTSLAAPQVAGVAAMLVALRPTLNSDQFMGIMRQSCDDQVGNPAEDTPGFDIYHGWGRLNAYRAVTTLLAQDFAVTNTSRTVSGDMTITWKASPGRQYQVLFADTPSNAWTPIGPSIVASNQLTTLSYTDTSTGAVTSRVYKVQLLPP